nr:hypothetical protein BaRGS_018724 [Batillaria attramentaria]
MADGLEKIGSRRHFQYIVVGCGGIGSGALYWLSKRAPGDVLGLEQFQLGHDNGGSQDVSRIIRLTYHDDRYTRLTPENFKVWAEVERESGQQLVYKTGGLQLSERGLTDHITEHYAQSMQRNNIPFERLTAEQLKARFPQFTPAPNTVALFEKEAGLVDAALGNATHVQLARGNGAVVIDRCPVTTTLGKFTCRRLVVTAGAWINDVLGSIGVQVPVTVTQEQVTYFATPHMKDFSKDSVPVFCSRFASLLGKILSELAVDGRTRYDILQFNMDRPAITDPNFKPTRNYVDAKL